MRKCLSEYWDDLLDFWKSQLAVGSVTAIVIPLCLWIFGEITSRKSLKANLAAVAIAYLLVIVVFAMANVIRMVYLAELRAYRKKEKLRQEAEDAQRTAAFAPSPNLSFTKFEVVVVEESTVGVKLRYGTFSQGTALIAGFRNEILRNDQNIAPANEVMAELQYRMREQDPAIPRPIGPHIAVANWLGLGGSASFQPGDLASIVMLYYKHAGTTIAIDTQHGSAKHISVAKGTYDILVTLTSRRPQIYLRRFHLIIDTAGKMPQQICQTRDCAFCQAFGVETVT